MLDCAIYDCLNKAETLYNNSYAGKYSSQFQLFFFSKNLRCQCTEAINTDATAKSILYILSVCSTSSV